MKTYTGKSIFNGIAIGKILVYQKEDQTVVCAKVQDVEAEIARYEAASQEAVQQLKALYEKAVEEVGEMNASVFEVHAMMLEDDDYVDFIKNMITNEQVNAEYAVAAAGIKFSNMFEAMEEEYFRARAADVKDISERVVTILSGCSVKEGIGGQNL